MAIQIPIIEAVTGLFGSLIGAIDDWHTSEEEKLEAKGKIFAAQGALLTTVFDYEKAQLQAQADIVVAEAKGDSFLQRSWRPITMLVFVALIVARWTGFTAPNLTPELEAQLMTLVQIGLGGYVVGRSAEKVAQSISFNKTVSEEA
jgi:hypothetical protein